MWSSMSGRIWICIGAVIVAVAASAGCWVAWRNVQKQRAQLQSELRTAQTAAAQAEARQQNRDAELKSLLNRLEKQRAAVRTPEQVIEALPEVLPLPKPLSFAGPPSAQAAGSLRAENSLPDTPASNVSLPTEDLKPLYDFAVECRECQARLTAAQADLKDEQGKTQTLGRERDDALRVARGGSVLQRVVRAAKWFAIGVAVGAIAVKIAH
jgi:hypothetical protein